MFAGGKEDGALQEEEEEGVYWKESPVASRLLPSGGGRRNVEQEIQGFVSRLAEVSPVPHKSENNRDQSDDLRAEAALPLSTGNLANWLESQSRAQTHPAFSSSSIPIPASSAQLPSGTLGQGEKDGQANERKKKTNLRRQKARDWKETPDVEDLRPPLKRSLTTPSPLPPRSPCPQKLSSSLQIDEKPGRGVVIDGIARRRSGLHRHISLQDLPSTPVVRRPAKEEGFPGASSPRDPIMNILDKLDKEFSPSGKEGLQNRLDTGAPAIKGETSLAPTSSGRIVDPPVEGCRKIGRGSVQIPQSNGGEPTPSPGSADTEKSSFYEDDEEWLAAAVDVMNSLTTPSAAPAPFSSAPSPAPSPSFPPPAPSHVTPRLCHGGLDAVPAPLDDYSRRQYAKEGRLGRPDDYLALQTNDRCLVLEVEDSQREREKSLRLLEKARVIQGQHMDLEDEEKELQLRIKGDWYDSEIEVGDTVNIVQDGSLDDWREGCTMIVVDDDSNYLILNPDTLISARQVLEAVKCTRRAVLQERMPWSWSNALSPKATLGSLKHDLFELALNQKICSDQQLIEQIDPLLENSLLALWEVDLTEEEAKRELENVVPHITQWMRVFSAWTEQQEASSRQGQILTASREPLKVTQDQMSGTVRFSSGSGVQEGKAVQVVNVIQTEDMIWSSCWGIKGATDATLLVRIGEGPGAQLQILPLEVKTGSRRFSEMDHRGQVILYTLLLQERYGGEVSGPSVGGDGLLLYLSEPAMDGIASSRALSRSLLLMRNSLAKEVTRAAESSLSSYGSHLPALLRSHGECGRCYQQAECMLYHKAIENGDSSSAGIAEIFDGVTGHLDEPALQYFQHWDKLLDKEYRNFGQLRREIWTQSSLDREQKGRCMSNMALLRVEEEQFSGSGAPGAAAARSKGGGYFLTFCRRDDTPTLNGEPPLTVGDAVVISHEDEVGHAKKLHVLKASVVEFPSSSRLVLFCHRSPPQLLLPTIPGRPFGRFRIDKDEYGSAIHRAKANLVQLFTGPPPEATNTQGVNEQRSLLVNGIDHPFKQGDWRRRTLVVDLSQPRFEISSRPPQGMSCWPEDIRHEYSVLNIDQKQAVEKALCCLDYMLILGMPGTGKTHTISFIVRVLLFRGLSVLLSSYTHSAVDNLLIKLDRAGVPVLRIGRASQTHPSIQKSTLDARSASLRTVSQLEQEVMNARVVGVTALGVNHVVFTKRRFDYCIVDEASQITQPINLGPLRSLHFLDPFVPFFQGVWLGPSILFRCCLFLAFAGYFPFLLSSVTVTDRCADTFILVGDHYQLPPLVADAEAQESGMDISLFRRLSEAWPQAVVRLTFQYRMHRDIMEISNRLIYALQLRCGTEAVATRTLTIPDLVGMRQRTDGEDARRHNIGKWIYNVLRPETVVAFIDRDAATVPEARQYMGLQGDVPNVSPAEIFIIGCCVEELVRSGVRQWDIAVYSPYRAQVKHLKHALKEFTAVEISTIDKSQGRDKECVFLSLARSNTSSCPNVGNLLQDWRRANVAFTRAKSKLVMVGSEQTLRQSPLFHDFFSLMRERHWNHPLTPADDICPLSWRTSSASTTT